jgi:hypothetical protein
MFIGMGALILLSLLLRLPLWFSLTQQKPANGGFF